MDAVAALRAQLTRQVAHWRAATVTIDDTDNFASVMASVYVPLAEITAINGAVNDGKTMDQAIADWIGKHADLIKRWENIKKD